MTHKATINVPRHKLDLASALPRHQSGLTLRLWTRCDVDRLATWPAYPVPFHFLNLSCAAQSPAVLDTYFASRENDPCRLSLVADLPSEPVIGYVGLLDIDCATGVAGKLVVRLHPAHCDRGLGTTMMRLLTCWAKEVGMTALRLDVAAANQRAIRCYAKAGFAVTGEFWRNETNLPPADLGAPAYALARAHMRTVDGGLQTRFYAMEFTVDRAER